MIACRLFEHYLFPPFLFFSSFCGSLLWGCTHPRAKESKIDHTSNWSRCTGTGSSSRADLSHAGKIMHPELTAQHTRLPSTSFLKCSRSHTIGHKQEGNIEIKGWFTHKWLSNVVWIEHTVVILWDWPDEQLQLFWLWLIHSVMWTAGNGITFVKGREDNTVTLDNSLAMNRNRPCQAISASVFSRTQTTNTLYQSLVAFPLLRPSFPSVGT